VVLIYSYFLFLLAPTTSSRHVCIAIQYTVGTTHC